MAISYLLTMVFLAGLLLVGGILLLTAWRTRNPRSTLPGDLPVEPERYGPLQTNRWLRMLRTAFLLACIAVLGFHGYWVYGVDANEGYSSVAARDLRNRRLAEAGLKGWVFDRTGVADKALVRYALQGQDIVRFYPLDEAAVHVTGYTDFIYGSGGLERAYHAHLTEPTSLRNVLSSTVPVGKDLQSTVDFDLQRTAFDLLKRTGKPGAAVVLSVPNNEVMAMASFPSFSPSIISDEQRWKALHAAHEKAPERSPLSDRALKTYYLPGSTFKVLVAIAALENGLGDRVYPCSTGGYWIPGYDGRKIVDDNGGGGHGTPNLAEALKVSCNQYFAQMALELGPERLAEAARRFGIETAATDETVDRDLFRVGSAKQGDFVRALAPPPSRLIVPTDLGPGWRKFELALEGFGQGPNDMTILQLALIASAIANPSGQLVKPALEMGLEPQVAGQAATPQSAQRVREMMKLVVDAGTAQRAFQPLAGRITAAGKTGTAQKVVVVRDPKTLEVKTVRNSRGELEPVTEIRIDALFIGFAPAENPRIAFAVVVEGGGHGGETAAPIAAALCEKARELGYIDAPPPPAGPRAGQGARPAAGRPAADRPRQPRGNR